MKRLSPLLLLVLVFAMPLGSWAQGTKDAEEEPEIIGIQMARKGGGYYGFNVENLSFVLRFYDEEKKEVAPDAIRAMARWNQPNKAGQQRTVLGVSGNKLSSPPVARPPYAFVVFLTLIGSDGEVMESISFNARSLSAD